METAHGKGADDCDFDCPPSVYGTGLIVGFGTGLPRSLDTQMSIFYPILSLHSGFPNKSVHQNIQ